MASRYIKDDRLILHCTVRVVKARLERPRHYRVAVPSSDMGQGLKALLDSGLGIDINFVVGDENFKAHKTILAARSPILKVWLSVLLVTVTSRNSLWRMCILLFLK